MRTETNGVFVCVCVHCTILKEDSTECIPFLIFFYFFYVISLLLPFGLLMDRMEGNNVVNFNIFFSSLHTKRSEKRFLFSAFFGYVSKGTAAWSSFFFAIFWIFYVFILLFVRLILTDFFLVVQMAVNAVIVSNINYTIFFCLFAFYFRILNANCGRNLMNAVKKWSKRILIILVWTLKSH